MISLIVPVYNAEKYLSKCIESILRQTYKNFELICINDGSTDASLNILQSYAYQDSRIKIINQKNKGQSIARNEGLKCVQGEYVAFVDSDDWLELDFLEKLYSSAQKNNADVVQSGFIQSDKKFIQENRICFSFDDILKNMNKAFVWNKLWKTKFIQDSQLQFLDNVYYEDLAFCLLAAFYAKKWNVIDYAGYNYFQNPVSSTQSQDAEKIAKRMQDKQIVSNYIMMFFKQHNNQEQMLNLVADFIISQLLENADLLNATAYKNYKHIFGKNRLLIKKHRKAFWKWLFQFSLTKKKLVFCGYSLWKNKKV